ncbi:MAG: 3'(2'),5'-bisphosphate nucleotidase CysQ [Alphaproteobacteria bacterium]|nr:3'(2'),5'-bisphosphate nucleotidase CysQ [Alphaproteobacteria bacterium]
MPTTDEMIALLPSLRTLAAEAAEVILPFYHGDVDVEGKADGTPVTEADRAADKVIFEGLTALTPDIPVVTEERVADGIIPDVAGGTFWLVDPLDGTKEFVRKGGDFTVNIGLIHKGEPVMGVIHVPASGVSYAGIVGQSKSEGAAWKWSAEERGAPCDGREIQVRHPDPDGLIVVASRSHRNPELDAYLGDLKVKDATAAGSSLKFCLVAEGTADLYPRTGPTSEWDTAAGHAIVLAAGGTVARLEDGQPLVYGKADERFLNPTFVARGG